MSGLSRRDRRALVIGAAIGGAVLLFVFVLRPYAAAVEDARAELARERDLLSREHALLSRASSYTNRLTHSDSALAAQAARQFDVVEPVAATAALTSHVASLAEPSRVRIDGARGMAPREGPAGLIELRASIDATADISGLMTLLRKLESDRRLVRVQRLDVEPLGPNEPGPYDASMPEGDAVQPLRLRLEVVGYGTAPPADSTS